MVQATLGHPKGLRIVNYLNEASSQGLCEGERLSGDLEPELKTSFFETDQYLAIWDMENISVKRKYAASFAR
jgi:hypothetical protein